jgi:hypothetical protein
MTQASSGSACTDNARDLLEASAISLHSTTAVATVGGTVADASTGTLTTAVCHDSDAATSGSRY